MQLLSKMEKRSCTSTMSPDKWCPRSKLLLHEEKSIECFPQIDFDVLKMFSELKTRKKLREKEEAKKKKEEEKA